MDGFTLSGITFPLQTEDPWFNISGFQWNSSEFTEIVSDSIRGIVKSYALVRGIVQSLALIRGTVRATSLVDGVVDTKGD